MEIYVVKAGDTLTSIAEQYNISKEEIIENNGLTNSNQLLVGQALFIRGSDEKLNSLQINGYAYPYIDSTILEQTYRYLTYITLFTYGFTPEGELIPIENDEEITDNARARDVAPLMLISTLTQDGGFSNELAHTLLNDYDIQSKLIENILINMEEKDYYGLDVDFEYILPEDRDRYSEFIERLRREMNENGYILMVALAPKTSSDQPGLLYESHDYYALGAAANYALVMTYEWGYTYECIRYASRQVYIKYLSFYCGILGKNLI